MTREERNNCIKVLKNFDLNNPKVNSLLFSADEITNAFDMAIKALEQEPCEDAISRKAAIDYCYQLINVEHQQGSDEMNYGQERVDQTETILHHLEFMPSVRPEPKTGRWIFVDKAHEHAHCSECDYGNVDLLNGRPHNYCTNCGCCMVEPLEREE